MNLSINFLIEFFAIIFEVIITFIFLESVLNRKFNSKIPYYTIRILLIIIFSYLEQKVILANFKFIIFIILLNVIACLMYEGRYMNKLLMSLQLMILFLLADLTTYCIGVLFYIPDGGLTDNSLHYRMFLIFLSKIFFLFYVKICNIKRISFYNNIKLTATYYTIIVCISIISLITFFTVIYCFQFVPHINTVFGALLGVTAGLLFLNLFIFYIYEALLKGVQIESDSKLMQQQYELQIKHFENIEKCQENLRSIKHDINNHFFCIKSFLDNGAVNEAINYISSIDKRLIKTEMFSSCGNIIIDALLNNRYEICKLEGIALTKTVVIPPKINIKNEDLCIVLSNILDNAIEACKKIKLDNRYIHIEIDYKKDLLFIDIKNNFEIEPIKQNWGFVTSKTDNQFHGIGLKNVKSTVEKYNGYVKIDINDKIFHLNIFMCDKTI